MGKTRGRRYLAPIALAGVFGLVLTGCAEGGSDTPGASGSAGQAIPGVAETIVSGGAPRSMRSHIPNLCRRHAGLATTLSYRDDTLISFKSGWQPED